MYFWVLNPVLVVLCDIQCIKSYHVLYHISTLHISFQICFPTRYFYKCHSQFPYTKPPALSDKKSFAISIRMVDASKPNQGGIKHYRIRLKEDGRGCYINPRRSFDSMTELIEHYKRELIFLSWGVINVYWMMPTTYIYIYIYNFRSDVKMIF